MKQFVSDEIERRKELLSQLSDQIWEYAETGYREFRSAAALIQVLRQEGFSVTEGLAHMPTAFSGSYGSGRPVIAILGEYDALNHLSQVAGLAKKQALQEGAPGHGCGHNLLGVGALAAAIAVKEYLKKTGSSGTVIYYGTPAEEGGSGKTFMARDGIFNEVDAALTWHPSYMNQVRTRSSLAVIDGRFTFYGKSAHASAGPHTGRSALDAVELMSVGTQYMREHIPSTARVHSAIIDAGGESPNVVPARAEVCYLCRDVDTRGALAVYEWLCQIAQGAAQMTQTRVEIKQESGCSNTVNNTVLENLMEESLLSLEQEPLTDREWQEMQEIYATYQLDEATERRLSSGYGKAAEQILLQHLHEPFISASLPNNPTPWVNPASTDVGDVSWVCPTAQMSGATWAAWSPGHAWQVVAQGKSGAAHKGMLFAGKVIALTAIRLLERPELVDQARAEWEKRVGPGGYRCPIPMELQPNTV